MEACSEAVGERYLYGILIFRIHSTAEEETMQPIAHSAMLSSLPSAN